jgi:hypothetical protein
MTKALTGYDTVFCNYGYVGSRGQKVCQRVDCSTLFDLLRQYNDLMRVLNEEVAKAGKVPVHERIALSIDEAGLNFPARSWKSISKREAYLFAQHRKLGIDLIYTAQRPQMVDSILRNNTAMSSWPRHFFGLFYEAWYEGCEKEREMFMYRTMWMGGRYYRLYDTMEIVESTKFYEEVEGGSVVVKDWGEVFHERV